MPVRIVSAGGGGITLSAANTGGEFEITLPAVNGALTPFDGRSVFRNLTIQNGVSPNSQVSVTADAVALFSPTGGTSLVVSSVNLTISTGVTGVNGLDTGSVAVSTWYYVYVISNGTTTAGLLSTNSTAPVTPSGYTFFARVGAVRTNASSNLLQTRQLGRRTQYVVVTGSTTPNLPILASGAQGSTSVPTWVAISTTAVVPPTASLIDIFAYSGGGSAIMVAPNNAYGALGSTTNPAPIQFSGSSTFNDFRGQKTFLLLESSNIFMASSGTAVLACVGWEDNL